MKPYNELTERGQLRRLRKLVLKGLEAYDLRPKWVKFLTIESSTMFYLMAEDGERYVFRIYSEDDSSLSENHTEMFWLDALRRDTDLKVVQPVKRRDGEYLTLVSVPGVPGEQRCAVYRWVPGRVMEHSLTPQNYFRLGQMMARLHDHAETLKPLPAHIQTKRWDKVFYYPNEPVIYNTPEYRHLFPSERVEVMDRVIERADRLFIKLFTDSDQLILIHGDMHYWNVHVYKGDLYLLDFEDIMLGLPLQDIAITLYYGRELEGYPSWREAFQAGYSSLRAWSLESEEQLETLMAARTANFVNYVPRILPEPEEFVETRCANLQRFLDKYG